MDKFNLKAWRKARKLTQPHVANALGVSVRAVQYWECGAASPPGKLLEYACSTLSDKLEALKREDALREALEHE